MRLLRYSIILLVVVQANLFLTQYARAQVAKLNPIDEAAKDPSFFAFRARLMKAVLRRDTAYVINVLDPAIKNSFGDGGGIAEFKRMWRPEFPNSKVWDELLTVLALGGKFGEGHSFMAPYTYSAFPDKFDSFEYGVILDDNVRVRQAPSISSAVIGSLSFDIVKVSDWKLVQSPGNKQSWIAVDLADNRRGYVAREFIRSPIDYRAIFNKTNGKWLMTAFIAGD